MLTKGTMVRPPPSKSSRGYLRVLAAGRTDVGRQRKHNEDHVLLKPELNLFAVADGMGGHNAGDVASKLTTTSLKNFYEATAEGAPFSAEPESADDLPFEAQRLSAAINKANHDVYEISSTYQQHQGMGSTVVAAAFVEQSGLLHVAHVGDSRCYRLRGGVLDQLTRDHSLINDALAMKPDLTEEELARLPKNIITRALGMKEAVKVDMRSEEVLPGDVYLLCSDGLSGMVPDHQILEILSITDDLSEACELLVSMANEAGGTDNITCVLLKVEVASDAARRSSSPQLSSGDDLEELLPADVASLLQSGAELDISAPSSLPPPMEPAPFEEMTHDMIGDDDVDRCPDCGGELYLGDAFCTTCGLPIES
jgi:PPM family protein phosphatase